MKWNKKKVLGIGATLFAAYLIPFSIFTAKTIKQLNPEDSIEFVVNNEVVKKSSNDEDFLLNGENASENADLIEIGFYKNALYGFDFSDQDNPDSPTDNSILGKYPGLLEIFEGENSFYNTYYDAYVVSQIYQNTTMSEKSLSVYIAELAIGNEEMKTDEVLEIVAKGYENLNDLIGSHDPDTLSIAFDQIKNIDSFRLSANIFLFETMFLLQESTSGNYDYRITETLASNPMSLVWYASLSNLDLLGANKVLIDRATSISEINDVYNTPLTGAQEPGDITVEEEREFMGDIGFEGLISSSSSTLVLEEDFWDYSNSWTIIPSNVDENGFNNIALGNFNNNMNNYFYLENNKDKIVTGDNRNSGYVVRSKSLYPFVFAYNYNATAQTASKYYYSIFAKNNGDNTYSYIDNDEVTSDSVSILDILYANVEEEIGTINEEVKSWYNAFFLMSIINGSSNTLLNSQNYWRNRGYYIKLNGEYEKIYGSEIDSGIQEI